MRRDLSFRDVGFRGGYLGVDAGEGDAALFEGLQILLGESAGSGGFSGGLLEGEFGFG